MRKSKLLDKLTTKSINSTFGITLFVLTFIFTFLITAADPSLQKHQILILIVFGALAAVVVIAWVALILIFQKYKTSTDENKQKISQAIEKLAKEADKVEKK